MIAHIEQVLGLGGVQMLPENDAAPWSALIPGSPLAWQWKDVYDSLAPLSPFRDPLRLVSSTNAAILSFLESWSREPDDKGEGWWSSFEDELEENRKFKERDTGQGA